MKPDIHPNYRPVVFKDNSADFAILTRSTVETKETITWKMCIRDRCRDRRGTSPPDH